MTVRHSLKNDQKRAIKFIGLSYSILWSKISKGVNTRDIKSTILLNEWNQLA